MHDTQFNNMGRRRFLGFAGASLAGAALIGCTGGPKSSSAPAASNAGSSAATTTAAGSVKPANEITFWSAAPANSKAVDEELVKRFQAKFPDIKVKYEVQGSNYAELSDKLAASIVAKVTRDRLMREHDAKFPGYDFARHKGYGTPQHLAALKQHGPCPIHRRSFLPVRQAELGI